MDEEQQRQFNENLKLLNDMIPNLVSAMTAQTKAINDSIATQNNSTKAQKDSTKATGDDTVATKENTKNKKELTEAQKFEIESTKKLAETKENLKKATSSGITGLTEFRKALLDTSTGFSKYSKALDSTAGVLGSVLSNFGFLGKSLAIVTQGATMLGKAFLEQTDNALKFKDELAKMGAVGVGTADDLIKLANSSGYTVAEFQKLSKPLASIGTGLVSLGTVAGDGAKTFLKMTQVTDETRAKFQRLGFSQEELSQSQADYIKLQQTSGRSLQMQGKSAEQLRKESLAYTENLVTLAALTGKNVEQIKKEQEAALSREETLIQTSLMEMEIARLKKSGSELDLQKAAQLEKEMAARDDLLKQIKSQVGDEKLSDAMSKFLATGAITQESAFLKQLGVPLEEFAERIKKGENVTGEFMNSLKQNADATLKQIGTSAMLDAEVRKQFGLTKEVLQFMSGRRGVDEKAAAEEARRKTAEQAAKGIDPAADARAKLTEVEIAAKTTVEELTRSMNPLLKDFPALHEALDKFKQGIEYIANMLKSGLDFLKNGFDGVTKSFVSLGTTIALATAALAKFASSKLGDLAGTLGGKGTVAGKIGGKAVGGVSKALGMGARALGKIAAPVAIGMAGYDAYKGFTADKDASTSQKIKNAGSSVLSGVTFGLLGKSAEEIANEKKLPATQASVRAVDNKIDSAGQTDLDKLFSFTARSGSKENFEELDESFKQRVINAATEYNSLTGKKIQINSSSRDPEDQKRLYQETVDAGRPGIGPTGMRVGKPGTSVHEHGLAVDIQQYTDSQAVQAFNNQGLFQKVPNDPVHFQARNGAIMSGPTSGYPVDIMAHGTEAIVPLPTNSILEKLSKMSASDFENTNTINTTNITSTNSSLIELLAVNLELKTIMENKLSAMIDRLDMSVNIQDKLYKNAI